MDIGVIIMSASEACVDFLSYFSLIEDPRIRGMVTYPGNEIILLSLCGTIANCNNWKEIEEYGDHNLEFLRKFLPYKNGIPTHQTIKIFFNLIDADYFSLCFTQWVEDLSKNISGIVSIDGKTLRGSRSGDKKALHMLTAFAHSQGVVLGQEQVDKKSNEITAIPQLLDKLIITGAIVTIDAMGTQKEIVKKRREKKENFQHKQSRNCSKIQLGKPLTQ